MDKKTIIIQGSEHPFQGLQKLLGGFCHPKKADNSDEDTITDGTHISEPDLTSQVHNDDEIHVEQGEEDPQDQHETVVSQSRAAVVKFDTTRDNNGEDEGEEVTLLESTKQTEREKQPEIIATSLNRSKRVRRGLGVALVAILAVLATLVTLHRLGYDLADIKFTSSDTSEEFSSKPLITIHYNSDKKIVATDPIASSENHIPSTKTSNEDDIEKLDTFESTNDKVDRVKEKLDELMAIVADIQNDSEL